MAEQTILYSMPPIELAELVRLSVEQVLMPALARLNHPTPEPRYYSRRETAQKLHVTLPTLHDHTQKGLIAAHRIGSRVLYREADIEKALGRIKTTVS